MHYNGKQSPFDANKEFVVQANVATQLLERECANRNTTMDSHGYKSVVSS
jgi:hypothetical protein